MPRSPSMLPKQPTQQQVMSSKLKRDFQYQGSEDPKRQQETFDNTGLNASSSDNQMFLGTFKNVRNSITAERDKDFNGSPRKTQNGKTNFDNGNSDRNGNGGQRNGTSSGNDSSKGKGKGKGTGSGAGTDIKSDSKWISENRGNETDTPEVSYFPGKSCSNGSSNTINIGLNIDMDPETDAESSRRASLNDTTAGKSQEQQQEQAGSAVKSTGGTGNRTAMATATATAISGSGKDTEDNIDNDDDTNYGIQIEPEVEVEVQADAEVEVEGGGVTAFGQSKTSSDDATTTSSCPTLTPSNRLSGTDVASSSSGSVSDTPMPRSSFRLLSTNPSFPSRVHASIRLPGAVSSPSFPSSSSRFLISPDKKAKARPTCYFSSPTLFQRVLITALAHPFLVVSVKMLTNPELNGQNCMYSYVYIVSRCGFQGIYSGIR